jgi:predicted CoA-binding protein
MWGAFPVRPSATLQHLFTPRAVAVIGASRDPNKVGYRVLENLIKGGFGGPIYPINPNTTEILGRKAYASLSDVDTPVDLAVMTLPAALVLQALEFYAAKGVGAAIVISAGFKEVGGQRAGLEDTLRCRARELGIRVLGPNCLEIYLDPLLMRPKEEGSVALDARIRLGSGEHAARACVGLLSALGWPPRAIENQPIIWN